MVSQKRFLADTLLSVLSQHRRLAAASSSLQGSRLGIKASWGMKLRLHTDTLTVVDEDDEASTELKPPHP